MIGSLMKKMGKYSSFEMIQNCDIAIIKKLSYVPLSFLQEGLPIRHGGHLIKGKDIAVGFL